jgi:hypothetical protein
LKKQADALAATIQEYSREFEAADCIRKKCAAALQRARRLEEFDDAAAVFCELLGKNQQAFYVSLHARKRRTRPAEGR